MVVHVCAGWPTPNAHAQTDGGGGAPAPGAPVSYASDMYMYVSGTAHRRRAVHLRMRVRGQPSHHSIILRGSICACVLAIDLGFVNNAEGFARMCLIKYLCTLFICPSSF